MKVERFIPRSPPPLFTMTFDHDEGLTLVMALRDAADKYTEAQGREKWRSWANALDAELRR